MKIIEPYTKPVRGDLSLKIYHKGILIEEVTQKNLIVTESKQILARSIGGDATYNITRFVCGTGSGAAVVGDNYAIFTAPFVKAIDSVTYPATNQVQYNFSLASGEQNGVSIREFGLLTPVGTQKLFSRIVRSSAINKNSDLTVAGTWLITF